MYWLEWRCHSITVAGALNNEKKTCLCIQSWMSNDNKNSAVFSSRKNSCNDDAARIEDGKPFQARAAATGNARSPSVTRLDQCWRRSRLKTSTCIYVGGLAEGLGKIRWCSTIKAAVHQNTQLELDPLRNLQPVQFTEKWGCVFQPPRREHQACGGIHDRL